MNQQDPNKDFEKLLKETADRISPNGMFVKELEEELKKAHKPRKSFSLPTFKNLIPAFSRAVVLAAFALFLVLIITKLQPQTAAGNNFVCPVTKPNGSLPPGETNASEYYLGNGELWTSLWPDGKVLMEPSNQIANGSFSMKWGWVRGVSGPLSIEGRRLDADAEPLRADIPEGYGDTGFQVSGLIFPTTGCWEVTGRVGDSSLTFVTEVIFSSEATPTPKVVIDPNGTPVQEANGGYNFRGGKLFLAQPLPESPATANVYMLNEDQPATAEQARALAERFGIKGELYTSVGRLPNVPTEYAISDGKQWLAVGTNNYFFYTSDMVKNSRSYLGTTNENAEAIIRDFLTARGFDFQFSIAPSDLYGGYLVQPLAADGILMQYDYYATPVMRVTLDENGEVLSMDASLINYDQTPVGTYGIISAEEALQVLLDDSIIARKIESMHSGGGEPPKQWYRQYVDGETSTIYGSLTVAPAVDVSKPALLLIDGVSITGNTSGLEALSNYTFIEATGKFTTENGIRKFIVDSWTQDAGLGYFTGSLRSEGDQIILTADGETSEEYVVTAPPADLPLNTNPTKSMLAINGTVVDGKLDWTFIQYFADSSQMGGGGGGGGLGFYQLNLSGTPVPFPTPTQIPTPFADENSLHYVVREGDTLDSIAASYALKPEQLMQANGLNEANIIIGQSLAIPGTTAPPKLEGARGMVSTNIFIGEDGSRRAEYTFTSSDPKYPYLILEGDNIEELQKYQNKPVKIWGTAQTINEYGAAVVTVDKFEVVFPDLQFELLKGKEKAIQLEGTDAKLFLAENGNQYVELAPNCSDVIPGIGDKVDEGTLLVLESLVVPDASFGGYPGICVFSVQAALDGNGNPVEISIIADKPNEIPEMSFTPFSHPNVTIDRVELVYYAVNPNIQAYDPTVSERDPYMQPVWHFHGYYESGEEIDIVIQALKQEFLSPDLTPHIQGG
jgi:LysM repeat protein